MSAEKIFENREISWLKFNERVLYQALDLKTPLLERLNFLSIYGNNLDEFFMVRVGSIFDQILLKDYLHDDNGETKITKIMNWLNQIETTVMKTYQHLVSEFKKEGIELIDINQLDLYDKNQMQHIWENKVRPFINPQILRGDDPFPFLENKRIYLINTLQTKQKKIHYGLVSFSHLSDHFYYQKEEKTCVISAVDIIEYFRADLLNKYTILESVAFRITRNADIDVEISLIDDDVDFRGKMEELLMNRSKLGPVRLQLDRQISSSLILYLQKKVGVLPELTVLNRYKLDLASGFGIYENLKTRYNHLTYPTQSQVKTIDFTTQRFMDSIKARDYLIAYPYHSSRSFIQLLHEAALDPQVQSIKIILYRVANPSRIVAALLYASEKGKDVTVVLELRARFDEERNIEYSKTLEEAGCHVFYGIPDYKVHSKVCVISMKYDKYITYIGTGNFNEKTQTQYTDLGFITTEQAVGEDAMELFDHIERNELIEQTQTLWIGPNLFRKRLIAEIDQEISFGKNGLIVMKMNSLNDPLIMNKLIEASQARVKVFLIIRGICCLIPKIEGFTDNITVKSILGRYLEHSRIYKFGETERARYYIGSGDLLNRNTQHRIEVFVKIKQQNLKALVDKILAVEMSDKSEGWYLASDGHYYHNKRQTKTHSQELLNNYIKKMPSL